MNIYRYWLSYFLLFFIIALNAQGQKISDTVNVLFIGNSFTIDNRGPDLFSHITAGAGIPVHVESFIRLGGSIKDFINNDSCWLKIKSRNWDFVVFQDLQSYYADTLGKFPPGILESNIKFQNTIKKLQPCVKIIYVAGWEKKEGFRDRFPNDNFKRLINRIMANYKYLNSRSGVHNIIAPVGFSWLRSTQSKTEVPLFKLSDNRHATFIGTYLYALTVYIVIFKTNPEPTLYINDISTADTRYICNIAYKAVMDTLAYTNVKSSSIKISKIGNVLVAGLGYHHYRWFQNGKEIIGSTGLILIRDHSKSIYFVKAVTKSGCIVESEQY